SVIFAREIREADKPDEVRAKRIREFSEMYENPYCAAERGYVDDVIEPSDTRKVINRALDALEDKCVTRPWRKYSNINL
ncbi:MAG: acyl-CoA carboxylase subunit beta, partial [Dehalococcoidia bacterium]|nr:acyl-CoA carboxylase subunit beta [Dehalococcoidia bacterium]